VHWFLRSNDSNRPINVLQVTLRAASRFPAERYAGPESLQLGDLRGGMDQFAAELYAQKSRIRKTLKCIDVIRSQFKLRTHPPKYD